MKRLSPMKSVRKYCLDCCLGSSKEVRLCPVPAHYDICPLHSLRFGKGVKGISPLKAIRKRCLDCGEGTPADVRNCEITDCALFQFRFGKNPARKGIGNRAVVVLLKKRMSVGQNLVKTGIVEVNADRYKQFLQETNV